MPTRSHAPHFLGLALLAALPLVAQSQSAARVEVAGGLQTATVSVPEGRLRVLLPGDMQAGDRISGTVMADPAGKNDKERSRNQGVLEGYVIEAGGRQGTMSQNGSFQVILPDWALDSIPVSVVNSAGRVIETVTFAARHSPNGPIMPEPLNPVSATTTTPGAHPPIMPEPLNPASAKPSNPGANGPIMPEPLDPVRANPTNRSASGPIMPEPLNPVRANPTNPSAGGPIMPEPLNPVRITPGQTQYLAPPISQSGHPFPIQGPFDGDAATTHVTIGGQTAPVLAESPRETVVSAPATAQGPAAVEVQESGTQAPSSASGTVRLIALQLSAGNLHLTRGEQTTLTVQVSGLQDLDRSVPLSLKNQTPSVVSLEGGNTQQFTVEPSQVASSGTYTVTRAISGLQTGTFDVASDVVYQEAPVSAPQKANPPAKTAAPPPCGQDCIDILTLLMQQAAFKGEVDAAREMIQAGGGPKSLAANIKPDAAKYNAALDDGAANASRMLEAMHNCKFADMLAAVQENSARAYANSFNGNDKTSQQPANDLIKFLRSIQIKDPQSSDKEKATIIANNLANLDRKLANELEHTYKPQIVHAVIKMVHDCPMFGSVEKLLSFDPKDGSENDFCFLFIRDLLKGDAGLQARALDQNGEKPKGK